MSTYQTHKKLYLKFKEDALKEDLREIELEYEKIQKICRERLEDVGTK